MVGELVLGGLIKGKNTEIKSGIPILSDLPFIGPLFGAQSVDLNRTELILLITPRVVRGREEARDVTAELRERFEAVLELERVGPRRPRRFKREE